MLIETEVTKTLKLVLKKDEQNFQPDYPVLYLSLCESNKEISKKAIRWPTGDKLPEKVSYNAKEEFVLINGETYNVRVNLPYNKVISNESSKPQSTNIYNEFTHNPVENDSSKKIYNSVRAVIENPKKSKKWASLVSELESFSKPAVGLLSQNDQIKLIESLKSYISDTDISDELLTSICTVFLNSRMFSLKNEEKLLNSLIETDNPDLLNTMIENGGHTKCDKVNAQLLKHICRSSDNNKEKLKKMISNIHSISPEPLSHYLSIEDAVSLMENIIELYQYESINNEFLKKALNLVSVLINSHGSKIINESSLHQRFSVVSNYFIEMQSIVLTFARFEISKNSIGGDEKAENRVRKVHLVRNKLSW